MNFKSKTYKSNGKLLLTAEYAVLDGAKALAIPTKYGQSLIVEVNTSNTLTWKSYDEFGNVWFEDEFIIRGNEILKQVENDHPISNRLIEILNATISLSPEFLYSNQGYSITTHQDFNRHWGLGTSSTLINNIANWAIIDAYKLLEKTFGGSGYDVACAQCDSPIMYQIVHDNDFRNSQNKNAIIRKIKTVKFNPTYKNHLYFVYLNQKQNSRSGIANYRKNGKISAAIIDDINAITNGIIISKTLSEFNVLMLRHENIISKLIKQETIQSQCFNDFNGVVKSLGAWGGDFVLVTSEINPTTYFTSKGFDVVIPFEKMVLQGLF